MIQPSVVNSGSGETKCSTSDRRRSSQHLEHSGINNPAGKAFKVFAMVTEEMVLLKFEDEKDDVQFPKSILMLRSVQAVVLGLKLDLIGRFLYLAWYSGTSWLVCLPPPTILPAKMF